MTCLTDLYNQDGVIEMQEIKEQPPTYAAGATSTVSTIQASFTQPSSSDSYQLQNQVRQVVMKKYPSGLFHPNG
jgi:hypothetical protein